jgi:peptidoglycan/LPS O-acetylase OafA/YrhL
VAVLAVILYHLDATGDWFPGGSLGVDLFFVLSGFLITTLLLEERWRTGTISLLAFYKRRARRLLPALVVFLALFTAITIIARQPGADRLPATLSTTLLYVFNWLDDFGGQGTQGAGHLWSLSVEEQFYLFWPLALIMALRAGTRALLVVSLVVFAASASLPAWSGRGYGELYSGTDFRAQELMAGAVLAQLRFGGLVTPSVVNRPSFRAALILAVVFFSVFLLNLENRPGFLFAGLYTAAAVLGTVFVCAALYAPPRILTNRVICYVGSRSYALYIWHHAIISWLRGLDTVPEFALSVGLSFAAAEISWRIVERRGSYLRNLPAVIRGLLTASRAESTGVLPAIAVQPRPQASEPADFSPSWPASLPAGQRVPAARQRRQPSPKPPLQRNGSPFRAMDTGLTDPAQPGGLSRGKRAKTTPS